MCWAAGIAPPRRVVAHGFVYIKDEETGESKKISKSWLKEKGLEWLAEPMEVIKRFNAEAFRYYFLRECPYLGDGDYSIARFMEVYNSDLANNLGNLYSRLVRLVSANYANTLPGTAGKTPRPVNEANGFADAVKLVQTHVEACRYNQALDVIWRQVLDPANQYADRREPWKLVKTDKAAAGDVLFDMVEPLRVASILLKPFLPKTAETIYRSFNFAEDFDRVSYESAAQSAPTSEDLRVTANLGEDGKPKPLFPRIG
jgi:methionyl-tRNA synthetase